MNEKEKVLQVLPREFYFEMLQTGSVLCVALVLMKTQPLKQDLYPSCAAEQSRARKKMKNEKKTNKSDRTAKSKAQKGILERIGGKRAK